LGSTGGTTTTSKSEITPTDITPIKQYPISEPGGYFAPRPLNLTLDPNRKVPHIYTPQIQPYWFRPSFRVPSDTLALYNPSSYFIPTDLRFRSLLAHYVCGATDQPFPEQAWANSAYAYEQELALQQTEMEQGLIPKIELPEESSLDINGYKMVRMGYTRNSAQSGNQYGNPQSDDVNMDQALRVEVKGTIARKTTVYVDYDDTREDQQNIIYVQYKGDPEELVEEATFGDIILSLPSTEFVSYSTDRAVFGAKLILRRGEFHLTSIGSYAKGQTQRDNFTGTKQFTNDTISDLAYVAHRYYIVNTSGIHSQDRYSFSDDRKIYLDPVSRKPVMEVYVYGTGITLPDQVTATARQYDDDMVPEQIVPGGRTFQIDRWNHLVQQQDYTVDLNTGVIDLNPQLQNGNPLYYVIGLAYKVADRNGNYLYSVGYQGDTDNVDLGNLKLMRDESTYATGGIFQFYELKNIYSLGAEGIDPSTLVMKLRDLAGNEVNPITQEPYIQQYGLDQNHDGNVDDTFIDYDIGLLTFPQPLPFDYDGDGTVAGLDAYSPPDPPVHQMELYTEYEALRNIYQLQPNIIPGSEQVIVDGQVLRRDIDYSIDYLSGEIIFLSDTLLTPNSTINITYEYRPPFAGMEKTLAGSRFEWKHDEADKGGYTGIWGATFLGEWSSKQRGVQYADLNDAPANQLVFDSDFTLTAKPVWMTNLAKLSPGVKTESPSLVELKLEAAEGIRNPNNTGVAKINDMESSQLATTVSLNEPVWVPASVPAAHSTINESNRFYDLHNSTQNIYRRSINADWGNDRITTFYFGWLPSGPGNKETWGGVQTALSLTGIDMSSTNYQYLEMLIQPQNIPYGSNGILHIDVGTVSEDSDSSGGFITPDPQYDGQGYIAKTEDANENGRLDQWYDDAHPPQPHDEDIGIVFDNSNATPPGKYTGKNNRLYQHENLLDSWDLNRNFRLDTNQEYFEYDIDLGGGSQQLQNRGSPPPYVTEFYNTGEDPTQPWYYVRIPLKFNERRNGDFGSPNPAQIKHVRMWVESTNDTDFNSETGYRSHITIAQLQFTANTWELPKVDPEIGGNKFIVETIDSFTNSQYVSRTATRDPDTNLIRKETSLLLKYDFTNWRDVGYPLPQPNVTSARQPVALEADEVETDPRIVAKLREGGIEISGASEPYGANDGVLETEDLNGDGILDPGEDIGWTYWHLPGDLTGADNGKLDAEDTIQGWVNSVKLSGQDDYSAYRILSVWVYNYTQMNTSLIFFIRFGSDEGNYFEYFQRVVDFHSWVELRADLDKMVELKQKLSTNPNQKLDETYYDGNYGVRGSPSLLNIKMVSVGLRTQTPSTYKKQGEFWVNDITLQNPIKKIGYARKVSSQLDFGGYLKLNGLYRRRDQDFSTVGDISSDMNTSTTNSAVSGILDFGKYCDIPAQVGIPVGAGYSESETFREDRYDRQVSLFSQGNTFNTERYATVGFSKPACPTLNNKYDISSSHNDKYKRQILSDYVQSSLDYNIPLRFFIMPKYLYLYGRRLNSNTTYGQTSSYVNRDISDRTDDARTTLQFEPILNWLVTPKYEWRFIRDMKLDMERSMTEGYMLNTSYTGFSPAKPNVSYSSSYNENIGLGRTTSFGFSNSSNLYTQLVTEPGNIIPGLSLWKETLRFTPSYSLSRASSYTSLPSFDRPDFRYRLGVDSTAPTVPIGDPHSSHYDYTWTLENRLSPLEFFSLRKNVKRDEWDWLDVTLRYIYSDKTYSTGSSIHQIDITWPDSTVRMDAKKWFPPPFSLSQRGAVTLTYFHKSSKKIATTLSYQDKPGINWNAEWTNTLRTITEFIYDNLKTISLSDKTSEPLTVRTISPGLTVTYRLSPQSSQSIPWLGSTLRLRNDLNLSASAKLIRIENLPKRSSTFSLYQDKDTWTYQLSGNYYFTTALSMTLTGTLTDTAYRTQSQLNSTSTSVQAQLEANF